MEDLKPDKARWARFLCNERRPRQVAKPAYEEALWVSDVRTEIERDFDRLLFSTPVRRLADKTQVFPLEKHDSVRTRLTHSHEVANLARSIGTNLVTTTSLGQVTEHADRDIPSLLAAVGLAHDLGNPPFGHQGETAIRRWIKMRVHTDNSEAWANLCGGEKDDFLRFEGNAQTFRLVSKLQNLSDRRG
jgi:dGTPase